MELNGNMEIKVRDESDVCSMPLIEDEEPIKIVEAHQNKPIVTVTKPPDKKTITNLLPKPLLIVSKNEPSEPELLGSVTTFTPLDGTDNGHTTKRTSARVIHKMLLDSIRPPTPPPPPIDCSIPKTPNQVKPQRNGWTNIERNFFFEAINEYGKEFDSISHYVNAKLKRKSSTEPNYKTREQVRMLYLQTYNKLARFLKFSDDVKKNVQELYALINYGEMRKKLDFFHEKSYMKLSELVYRGTVTIRVKGKNLKIKTPSCKVLRQINQMEAWQEEIKLPQRIEVNIKSANIEAWEKVQNLAQNPRVKVTVALQKKVISLINTLQHKWRSEELRVFEKAMTLYNKSSTNRKNQNEFDSPRTIEDEPLLYIKPSPDAVIHRPMINLTEFLSSQRICLNSYEERIGAETRGEILSSNIKESIKLNSKRQRHDSNSDKKSPDSKKLKTDTDFKPLDINDKSDMKKCDIKNVDDIKVIKSEDIKIETDLTIKSESENVPASTSKFDISNNNQGFEIKSSVKKKEQANKLNKKERKKFQPLINEENIKQIRDGVTLETISDLTFGDLYILFGQDGKLNLEYAWKDNKKEKVCIKTELIQDLSANDSGFVNESCTKSIKQSEVKSTDLNLGSRLKQLLMIASLSDKNKKKITASPCSCGHTCDKSNKFKKSDDNNSFVANKSHASSSNSDGSPFRQPTLPIRNGNGSMDAYKVHINSIRLKQPSYLKSRNRAVFSTKQVLVQRYLPLQPGVNQTYVPTESLKHESDLEYKKLVDAEKNAKMEKSYKTFGEKFIIPSRNYSKNDFQRKNIFVEKPKISFQHKKEIPENKLKKAITATIVVQDTPKPTPVPVPIPTPEIQNEDSFLTNLNDNPGINSLMEISLPPSPIRITTNDTNTFDAFFCGSEPPSPMRLLRDTGGENSNKWLDADTNDFSLSSFLGHLDAVSEANKKSRNDTEHNFSVLGDTSIDYMSKFAEIAAELQAQENME